VVYIRVPLATTYARALMELARAAGRLRPVLEEVREVAAVYRGNREFRTFLEIPSIGVGVKVGFLERVFRGKVDDIVLNFLMVVVEKHRQFLLPAMFAECEELYDQEVGRIHVEVITSVPLDEKEKAVLDGELEKKAQRPVIIVNRVAPEVLGGMIVRYHDRVTDASVGTALGDIGRNLRKNRFGSEMVHENQSR
jgi:F-type H+-transporting ATPase subunit delta